MERVNTIGIVGTISEKPRLILDAKDWRQRVYETMLRRERKTGGLFDEMILRYSGKSAGSEAALELIDDGVEVMIGGEIQSENVNKPAPEENRVKVFIFAELIAVNDPPADPQNEVKICGTICRPPRVRNKKRRGNQKYTVMVTDFIVAVNGKSGAQYVPCVCWGADAKAAAALEVGTNVEIEGHFQSRQFKKYIDGKEAPYLCTAYEVSASKFGYEEKDTEEGEDKEE